MFPTLGIESTPILLATFSMNGGCFSLYNYIKSILKFKILAYPTLIVGCISVMLILHFEVNDLSDFIPINQNYFSRRGQSQGGMLYISHYITINVTVYNLYNLYRYVVYLFAVIVKHPTIICTL